MALTQKTESLVNMSLPRTKRPLEFQLEPPPPKRKSSSKLPLWVGPEVRVMGLKTETVVAPQPATGATYQPILMGHRLNKILQPGWLMLTDGWDVSKRSSGWGLKGKIEMTDGFDGPPWGEDHTLVATLQTWSRGENPKLTGVRGYVTQAGGQSPRLVYVRLVRMQINSAEHSLVSAY